MSGKWYELSGLDKESMPKGVKPWMLSLYVEAGEMYMPAELGDDPPSAVMLMAMFDGVKVLRMQEYAESLFVPASWLVKQYPDTARAISNARKNVEMLEGSSGH